MTTPLMELLIGTLFIVIFTYDRFNSPSSNRLSTTAVRYHVAAALYCLIYLVIYYIATKYPALIAWVWPNDAADVVGVSDQLPEALMVALLITVLLPKVPLLNRFDAWLIELLRKNASIPYEAFRLSRQLTRYHLSLSDESQNDITTMLEQVGLDASCIQFDKSNSVQYLWTKVSALKFQLEKWEENKYFAGYLYDFSDKYKKLTNEYKQLTVSAKICFELKNEEQRLKNENQMRDLPLENTRALTECFSNFERQCNSLLAEQCEFISQGILKYKLTRQARINALREMGFELPSDNVDSPVSANQLASLLVMFSLGLLVTLVIFSSNVGGIERKIFLMLMISTMFVIAVSSVVYTKGLWKFTERDEKGQRPILYYIAVGLFAVAITVPVTLFFKILYGYLGSDAGGFMQVVEQSWAGFISKSYPWKLLIFITAAFTAFQLDNKPSEKIPLNKLRHIEALSQALITMLATYVVSIWLADLGRAFDENSLYGLLIRNAFIGYLIGYFIPYWYRSASRPTNEDERAIEVNKDAVALN